MVEVMVMGILNKLFSYNFICILTKVIGIYSDESD